MAQIKMAEQQNKQIKATPMAVTCPGKDSISKKGVILVSIFLVLATLAVYGQVYQHDFVQFDDMVYVTDNAQVKAGLTWESCVWAFTNTRNLSGNWHPLTWLSHMLDCELFGIRSGYHHLTNLVLHIVNSLLLFGFFNRVTKRL